MFCVTTVDRTGKIKHTKGELKYNTGKRLLMIKDSNTLKQVWEEFMKCPSLEVLKEEAEQTSTQTDTCTIDHILRQKDG